MNKSRNFWRTLFFLVFLAALCGSFVFPVNYVPVSAAPQLQAVYPPSIVISEFRARGAAGADDEFIEIFNATNNSVTLNNWVLRKSSGCGTTLADIATINTTIPSGGYYLVAKSPGFTGTADLTYTTTISDDGGIALINGATIIDQVGMCSTTTYQEGTTLAPLTTDVNQSYERKAPGEIRNCTDTNNNAADFVRNASSSNPQTSSSPAAPCLYVTNVDAITADGTYNTAGTPIDIAVTFSGIVFADSGSLLLETGVTDRSAIYFSGSGTNTLTFRYTTVAGDFSLDLDYVSSTALSGTIYDTIGNANLTLPSPGAVNSLGANSNIAISIDDGAPPSVVSIRRQNPTSMLTNANNLVFRVMFSENITSASIDAADFVLHPNSTPPTTTAPVTNVTGSANVYDVTVSGGDLAGFNGVVGLDLSGSATIQDLVGNNVVLPENLSAANDETYLLDNQGPTVTVDQTSTQADPTGATPVNFTVVFSEPIVVSTFTATDITQPTSSGAITWVISNPSNDRRTFNLVAAAITTTNVVLTPSIAAGVVTDDAGNTNSISTSTDNSVTFTDTTPPSVTIARASGQAASTTILPVRFTVTFSEAINVASFTPADITQSATSSPASGITWTITDSGDRRTFTLSATVVTVVGNITPFISANRVTDVAGNGNTVTTSTATVNYGVPSTPTSPSSVIINEVAWSGTAASTTDEWIELRNATASEIDITGWTLHGDDNVSGQIRTPNITLSGTIPAGGLFLVERVQEATTAAANQIDSSIDLLNGGERLYLKDTAGTTIDTANLDGGSWPAGTAAVSGTTPLSYASMERVEYANQWVTYAGTVPIANDRNGNPIKGTPGGQNWIRTATVTTITADTPDPSVVNQNVTVSVTVVGGTSTPTGTVAITGANTNCTITLTNGSGSCTTVKFTSTGTKTLTATYSGDASHPASNDTETHTVSTTTTIRTPTPTRVPTLAPPPPLVAINEFVPRPGHDWNNDGEVNVLDEYIEIINHGTINVNLSGYSLDDEANIGSSPYRLPSVTIVPGERIVFYASETGLLLSDGGDGVRLLKANGQLADAYNYTVARYPDQSYCRLPDNGGLDDWNQNCFPTPGLQNSLSGDFVAAPVGTDTTLLCPIADTLPEDFVIAECAPYGNNIWRRAFWDQTGWYGEKVIPNIHSRWDVFAD